MARNAVYNYDNSVAEYTNNKKEWNVALYIRLSREDGDKVESDSVVNQKTLLNQYVNEKSEFSNISVWADDGYTGTHFKRPNFIAMMKEVRKGTINCIIVKDLSRLGRNFIESSIFLEEKLPEYNCRFISILDDLDSHKNPEKISSIIVHFKSMMNDHYSKDISIKMRDVYDIQRKEGKLVCAVAPYGYKKDPSNHHKLILDNDVAHIVKEIFDFNIGGMGCVNTAKRLNKLGVLSPSMYKLSIGIYKSFNHNCSKLWRPDTVRNILNNMTYTGSLEQKKKTTLNHKNRKKIKVKKEDRIVVLNTHEPIISMDTYINIQNNYKKCLRTSEKRNNVYLFSGFLRCPDCGGSLIRNPKTNKGKEYVYYKCRTYAHKSRELCPYSHSIRHEDLEEAVYYAIKSQIYTVANMQNVIAKVNTMDIIKYNKVHYGNDIKYKQRILKIKRKRKACLYEDFRDDILTRAEYLEMKVLYNEDIECIEQQIQELLNEQKAMKDLEVKNINWMNDFLKHNKFEKLSRQLLMSLVDKIYVGKDKTITIDFIYKDTYSTIIEFIQNTLNKEVRYHAKAN